MEDQEYEKAWADKPEQAAPAVAEAAAESNTVNEPETNVAEDAVKAAVVAPVAVEVQKVAVKPGSEVRAEADAKASSDAEEFRKAFAETPDVK